MQQNDGAVDRPSRLPPSDRPPDLAFDVPPWRFLTTVRETHLQVTISDSRGDRLRQDGHCLRDRRRQRPSAVAEARRRAQRPRRRLTRRAGAPQHAEGAVQILPGSSGGVESDLALAGDTVYVATCNLPFAVKSMTAPLGTPTMSLARATGDLEALNLATGKVEWDTRLKGLPLGDATVPRNLVFTTLYPGILLAFDRTTGAIVERLELPTSTNLPIAIAGNTVLVPAGGATAQTPGGDPQLIAYSTG
jgi:hypothetical protein